MFSRTLHQGFPFLPPIGVWGFIPTKEKTFAGIRFLPVGFNQVQPQDAAEKTPAYLLFCFLLPSVTPKLPAYISTLFK